MTKKALLVGILYNGTSSQLTGCENDIDVFTDLLTNRYGFLPENIKTLTESNGNLPNEENIRTEVSKLIEEGQVGDTLVFVYSGHGSSLPDYDGDEPDGKREALCPMGDPMPGSRWSRPRIADSELMPVWELLADGVTLYCFFDCCHSGTMLDLDQERELQRGKGVDIGDDEVLSKRMEPTDEEKGEIARLAEERAFDQHTRQITPYEKMKGVSGGQRIYSFSGCQDAQTSADSSRGIGGKWNGAFTTALFRILSKTPSPTVGTLIDEMRVHLKNAGYSQIPHLSLSEEGSFRDVFMRENDAPDLDTDPEDVVTPKEAECKETLCVSASGGPSSFEGWPALEYVTLELTEDLLPLGTVFTEVTASDQGFGNTGSSKAVLVLYDADGAVKHDAQVALCSHFFEHYHLKMKRSAVPWLKDAAAGDRFALLLVSAPWSGWACKAAQGCIRVEPAPKLKPFTAKAENLSSSVVAATDAGRTDLEIDGWPAKIHSSLVLQHGSQGLTTVEVGCVSADQGFGGTGSSKVVLALMSKYGDVNCVVPICEGLSHEFTTYKAEFGEDLFGGAEPGEKLAIVLVSAPWPGWACRCLQSRIVAHFDPEAASSKDEARLSAPEVFKLADEVKVTAAEAGETLIEVDSWPARACLRAPLIEGKSFPPKQVSVKCSATDQGFGGSDAAKVVLALLDADDELKGYTQVGEKLTHDLVDYTGTFGLSDDCLSCAEAGDTLALVVVSPPWGGWEARCASATLEVQCFANAEAAAKIKQLFKEADANGDSTMNEEEFQRICCMMGMGEEEASLLLARVDKNSDGRIDANEFIDWLFEVGVEL